MFTSKSTGRTIPNVKINGIQQRQANQLNTFNVPTRGNNDNDRDLGNEFEMLESMNNMDLNIPNDRVNLKESTRVLRGRAALKAEMKSGNTSISGKHIMSRLNGPPKHVPQNRERVLLPMTQMDVNAGLTNSMGDTMTAQEQMLNQMYTQNGSLGYEMKKRGVPKPKTIKKRVMMQGGDDTEVKEPEPIAPVMDFNADFSYATWSVAPKTEPFEFKDFSYTNKLKVSLRKSDLTRPPLLDTILRNAKQSILERIWNQQYVHDLKIEVPQYVPWCNADWVDITCRAHATTTQYMVGNIIWGKFTLVAEGGLTRDLTIVNDHVRVELTNLGPRHVVGDKLKSINLTDGKTIIQVDNKKKPVRITQILQSSNSVHLSCRGEILESPPEDSVEKAQ